MFVFDSLFILNTVFSICCGTREEKFHIRIIFSIVGHVVLLLAPFLKYSISGIFRVGLIFAKFVTSLKSLKLNTVKNKPYYTSSLRVLEIAKIGLCENLPSKRHFSPKFPDTKNSDIQYLVLPVKEFSVTFEQ